MFAVTTASPHPIARIAFHPDGSTIAVGQPNFGVTLLDRAGGRITGTVPVPRVADYTSMVFCDGGSRLAIGSIRGIHLFDTPTGALVGHTGGWWFRGAALAERGRELIAATRQGLSAIRVPPDTTAGWLWSGSLPLQSRAAVVALSPCGRWAFGVYSRVRPSLIGTTTGRVAVTIDHPYRDAGNTSPTVTFSPDSGRFVVCDGNAVAVYDTPYSPDDDDGDDDGPPPSLVQRAGGRAVAPKPRAVLAPVFVLGRPDGVPPEDDWRPPVAFTPGGHRLLVRRPRNRVQLWDLATGVHAGEWSWRMDGVAYLTVAPDGLTAVAGARFGRVVVWDLE